MLTCWREIELPREGDESLFVEVEFGLDFYGEEEPRFEISGLFTDPKDPASCILAECSKEDRAFVEREVRRMIEGEGDELVREYERDLEEEMRG